MKPETLEPMELALGTRQAALQRRQIAGVWVLAGRVLLLGFLFGFALRGLSKGTIIRGFIRVPISVLSALPEDVNRTEHTATSVCGACIFVLTFSTGLICAWARKSSKRGCRVEPTCGL